MGEVIFLFDVVYDEVVFVEVDFEREIGVIGVVGGVSLDWEVVEMDCFGDYGWVGGREVVLLYYFVDEDVLLLFGFVCGVG